jgi:predicted AAA+ superfamily ATPase
MVFESIGSELSLRRLSSSIGLSVDTVSSYLDAAENAYLCFCCHYFTYSGRQRAHRNKKYYAIDTGLRRSVITQTGQDLGKDFENMVFLALRRRYPEVCYWKGTQEVDFVVESDRGLVPIQVSWDGPKMRHDKALDEFYQEFRHALDPVYVSADNFADGTWLSFG